MIHAELSEAVRRAVIESPDSDTVLEVVERARSALVEAEGISLFGLETDHPELGTVHWIVGQPGNEEPGYLVLAIGSRWEDGEALPMFAAADEDLNQAFRQVISDCGMPEAA